MDAANQVWLFDQASLNTALDRFVTRRMAQDVCTDAAVSETIMRGANNVIARVERNAITAFLASPEAQSLRIGSTDPAKAAPC